MSTVSVSPAISRQHDRVAGQRIGFRSHVLRSGLDALVTRRATRTWWIASAIIVALGLILHVSAWLGIPTIATADTNAYCELMHTIEAGQLPDLRDRNIGYPLFMYACKLLPISLNRALPLVQHLLEVSAAVVLMVWMRQRWGVLAGLMTGVLLLVNSGRVIWTHYGHPNALLCSLVPLAVLALMGYMVTRRRWYLFTAGVLWLVVLVNRDEVLLLAGVIPATALCFCRPWRWRVIKWYAVVAVIVLVGGGARQWINVRSTDQLSYSTHAINIIAWRGVHARELVAPPRPEKLERLYAAALANGARWRDGYLHYEDLWRAGRDQWGMTQREAIDYMAGCALECIQRRPGTYARVVLRDSLRLWLKPQTSLEWYAFSKSRPDSFARDASRIPWATHNQAEFPVSYQASSAQGLFHSLAILRPDETFAMKPLALCFVVGSVCLLSGIGCRRLKIRRWWFVGLAISVVFMTLFYAAVVDVPQRFRMSVEWAFFAIASLGLVLPLRAIYHRSLAQGDSTCGARR
ncbi:MAG: hypothetical protein JSU63_04025 [Phycisphaerales bacterium]|nr:MAG: hypothetical protein JSU63_04025 [Phycisphaerales bacterium]